MNTTKQKGGAVIRGRPLLEEPAGKDSHGGL